MQCEFRQLRTEWCYVPTGTRSLASPTQSMAGMAWRGVAWYGMAWRERLADVR